MRMLRAASPTVLPPEVAAGAPRVVVYGAEHVLVERHGGVVALETDAVRIRTPNGILRVTGRGLSLRHLGATDALVAGRIAGVYWEAVE